MSIHTRRVLLRKGLKRSMPSSAPMGELLYCKDTNDLFVGVDHGVKQLTKGENTYDGGFFGHEDDSKRVNIADGGEFND